MLTALRKIKHQMYLRAKDKEVLQEAQKIRESEKFKKIYASLDKTFELPDSPVVRGIWAIAMVRNEADIIESTLKNLVKQGIDHILVVDNNSSDGTYEIIKKISSYLPLTLGRDNEPAYFQSEKMTWLADFAARHGAEWILPFDADELWMSYTGSIKDALRNAQEPILLADIYNQFPQVDDTWAIDSAPHFDPKVAFQVHSSQVITMGNHSVLRPGQQTKDVLWVLHRPWRSFNQFLNKVRQGATSIKLADLPADKGYHWQKLGAMNEDELYSLWTDLIEGRPVPEILAWRPLGTLVKLNQEIALEEINPKKL